MLAGKSASSPRDARNCSPNSRTIAKRSARRYRKGSAWLAFRTPQAKPTNNGPNGSEAIFVGFRFWNSKRPELFVPGSQVYGNQEDHSVAEIGASLARTKTALENRSRQARTGSRARGHPSQNSSVRCRLGIQRTDVFTRRSITCVARFAVSL
jgi:hypothetical protein